ncbi:site-2 protease family protein [bacterium]|nr:site-2 protease family protein [bacterium]
MIFNILLSLLILNIMVIVHELGHYLLAKRNGIEVDEFAIGFGPVLWKKKWKGTKWMIKAFPLGGYNGLKGETESEGGAGNFSTASKKAKFQVLIAGSLMNVFTAVLAFYITLGLYGWIVPVPVEFTPVGAEIKVVGPRHPIVEAVVENSPASKLDIKPPYQLISINGLEVETPGDVSRIIDTAQHDEMTLEIRFQDDTRKTVNVTRDKDRKLGISMFPQQLILDYGTSFTHKIFSGFSHTVNVTMVTGKVLGDMISFTSKTGNFEPLSYAFAGPVAIVAAVDGVVSNSNHVVADLANMTGLIGVSLAVFNLLPFPGLDGWHIFLLFYEKARKRKPNEKLVGIITAIGLFLLLTLGVLIMVKDVWFFFLRP